MPILQCNLETASFTIVLFYDKDFGHRYKNKKGTDVFFKVLLRVYKQRNSKITDLAFPIQLTLELHGG